MTEPYVRQAAYYCSWSSPARGEATAELKFQDEAGDFTLLAVVARGRDADFTGPRAEACKRRMARQILERESGGGVPDWVVERLVTMPASPLMRVEVRQVRAFLRTWSDQLSLLDLAG